MNKMGEGSEWGEVWGGRGHVLNNMKCGCVRACLCWRGQWGTGGPRIRIRIIDKSCESDDDVFLMEELNSCWGGGWEN